MSTSRQGQMQMPFHWIYVLIAGGVILLFFVSIVVKQKESATQQLGTEVNRILESIVGAASVSESTKSVISTAGLVDETLYFQCTISKNAESRGAMLEYGLVGKGAPITDTIVPIFAPAQIKGTQLFLWSLPYKLPFKIIDLLYVTGPTVHYFLVGESGLAEEFLKEAKSSADTKFKINVEKVTDISSISSPPGMTVRIVDYTGVAVQDGAAVPAMLQTKADAEVSAVAFGDGKKVTFFRKEGKAWKLDGVTTLFSLSGELDALRYAAIFAANKEMFDCGMRQAFKRAMLVSAVYAGRGQQVIDAPLSQAGVCPVKVSGLHELIGKQKSLAESCVALYPDSCADLVANAAQIKELNSKLEDGCIPLY